MSYIAVVTQYDMIGYDASLAPKFLETIFGTFTEVYGIAWQPGSVYFSLILRKKLERLNVLKYTPLCHTNCADCDLLPTATHMNCKICLTGLTLKGSNLACEATCSSGQYLKSDYSGCENCPTSCPDCGFETSSITYPFVPLASNLICSGSDAYTVVANEDNSEFKLTFESNPVSVTTDNIQVTTSSNWTKNDQFKVEIQTNGNPKVFIVKFSYLLEEYKENISISIGNIQVVDPLNSKIRATETKNQEFVVTATTSSGSLDKLFNFSQHTLKTASTVNNAVYDSNQVLMLVFPGLSAFVL